MNAKSAYRARLDQMLDAIDRGDLPPDAIDHMEQPLREPLSAGQHILHLLVTVFTAGLWLPVWIIRGMAGNKVYPPAPAIPQGTYYGPPRDAAGYH